jgi:CheY-like chemotaxis protein
MIVDDDARVREAAATVLKGAGIEVASAADGEAALTLFARQWFPVLITDREMPVMDGIEFVHRVRAFAVAPAYIIMLTESNDSQEYETGYCAGVDHFLSKQSYESELAGRVATGLVAIQRRQTTGAARSDDLVVVDLASGAHTARHLVGRLHAEIALASRHNRTLTVLSVCVEATAAGSGDSAAVNLAAASAALLTAIQDSVRPRLDWIARLPAAPNVYRLAIVMPETGADVTAVEQGIRNTFVHASGAAPAGTAERWFRRTDGQRPQADRTRIAGRSRTPPPRVECEGAIRYPGRAGRSR